LTDHQARRFPAALPRAHDPHAYRITTLQNGLTCMLINDKPKSAVEREREAAAKQRKQKAGSSGSGGDSTSGGASDDRDDGEESESKPAVVALSVRVGHWSDPAAIPGLAHFLEHMLFMGNQQFPSENEWEEYLSGHGGASNAFTDSEYTCYYFEINPAFLHPALQRFAQFFVSPLFAASARCRREAGSKRRRCLGRV
jgi:nardilysin